MHEMGGGWRRRRRGGRGRGRRGRGRRGRGHRRRRGRGGRGRGRRRRVGRSNGAAVALSALDDGIGAHAAARSAELGGGCAGRGGLDADGGTVGIRNGQVDLKEGEGCVVRGAERDACIRNGQVDQEEG